MGQPMPTPSSLSPRPGEAAITASLSIIHRLYTIVIYNQLSCTNLVTYLHRINPCSQYLLVMFIIITIITTNYTDYKENILIINNRILSVNKQFGGHGPPRGIITPLPQYAR